MLDLPTLSPMIYIASPDEPIFYLMTSYDASLEGQRLLSVIFELVYRALSYASTLGGTRADGVVGLLGRAQGQQQPCARQVGQQG